MDFKQTAFLPKIQGDVGPLSAPCFRKEKLIKIGAKVVSPERYISFQMER